METAKAFGGLLKKIQAAIASPESPPASPILTPSRASEAPWAATTGPRPPRGLAWSVQAPTESLLNLGGAGSLAEADRVPDGSGDLTSSSTVLSDITEESRCEDSPSALYPRREMPVLPPGRRVAGGGRPGAPLGLSLIHISEPTRPY